MHPRITKEVGGLDGRAQVSPGQIGPLVVDGLAPDLELWRQDARMRGGGGGQAAGFSAAEVHKFGQASYSIV